MRTKEERASLHRSQIRTRNSLNSPVTKLSNNRNQYVRGRKGVYENIKIDGTDFYLKLRMEKK